VVAQLVLLLVVVCGSSHQAWAGPGVLVVMHATDVVDASPYELRLRSELQTEGLDAVIINANATTTEPTVLASRLGTNGIIDITLTNDEALASVWVIDSAFALEITRSIKVNLTQRDSVAVFALRTVDLFLGARLELEQQRRLRAPATAGSDVATAPNGVQSATTASAVTAPSKQKKEARTAKAEKATSETSSTSKTTNSKFQSSAGRSYPERVRIGGGIALMQFTDDLQRKIAPSVTATLTLSKHWAMGLTLTGPYVATILTNVQTRAGGVETNQATIDQEFFWLDGRYRWSMSEQFDLEPNLGLGVARYAVSGQGGSTYVGRNAATASLLTSLSASLVWHIAPRVRLVTEVAGLVRWQTPLVMVDGQDETGTSPLNFWGSFGPAWVF
jgi:hypothetical protein